MVGCEEFSIWAGQVQKTQACPSSQVVNMLGKKAMLSLVK